MYDQIMAQNPQNKNRTTITLMSEDVVLINQFKSVFEKETEIKISNIDAVRKALKIALRHTST